jgi:ABC-type bacteriocin/lantibiotic exporter with double-glycine peptidase domain
LKPIASFIATLAFFAVAFSLLHVTILWLRLPDLAALLLLAIPVIAYLAYCTQQTRPAMLRSAIRIYASFTAVVLSAGGLVYLIG